MRIVVIDSGVANLASVLSAFRALDVEAVVTRSPAAVRKATHVVLPGVGTFGAGMETLRRGSLDRAIAAVHREGRPLLAICLGMQLLGEESAENPGVDGLGIVPGRFEPLPSDVRVPHLGWNGVEPPEGESVFARGEAAFANSYGLIAAPAGWDVAWTTHGIPVVSGLAQGRTVACQFHPELSSEYGLSLLRRWISNERVVNKPGDAAETNLLPRIVPCLDIKDGRVVKGINFQNLRDAGDPVAQAARYECDGADEIVMLDVAASPKNRNTQLEVVRRVRNRVHIPLTVGGGVRTVDDARRLLAAGADKVSVNTAAVSDPSLLTQMANAFGRQCVVLAIDARRAGPAWEVLVLGGREATELDALQWAREGVDRGAGEILLTSWDRDGTQRGCDLELLAAMRHTVSVPVIASGGIGTPHDVAAAFGAGADAVLAASVFHDRQETVTGIKNFLAAQGLQMRR